jgi:hypothetical protein
MSTWPTTVIEYGSFNWLRREVSPLLGLPHDVRLLDHVDRNRIDSVIDSGLRLFYFPNPSQLTIADATEAQKERLRRAPHQWSFLQKTASLEMAPGVSVYDLPADFANFLDDPITSRSGERISIVSASHLRQLLASSPSAGPPKYAAIEVKSHDGSSSQRSEIILYPTPSSVGEITIRYGLSPTGLNSQRVYPRGGQEHAETILACCAVVAAERSGGLTDSVQQRYADRMAASVLMDAHAGQASSEGVWPVDEADNGLNVDRNYLGRLVGRDLGYGPNRHAWTFQQSEMVKEAIKTGLRRFYNPAVLPGERYPHVWSFLSPLREIQTVASESVIQMPVDFTMLEGQGMTYTDSTVTSNYAIQYIGESQLRRYQSQNATYSGRPQFVAIRVSNDGASPGSRQEAVFWPVPNDVYTIQYRSRIDPVMLAIVDNVVSGVSDGASIPEGGQVHAQTIIESCLLACDELMKRDMRVRTERFREFLYASVGFDRKLKSPDSLGYNGDRHVQERFDYRLNRADYVITRGST